MKFSLRSKLSLLLAGALCLTVAPILFLTWRNVGGSMLRMEREAFLEELKDCEDSLNLNYLHLLTNKVSSVMQRKRGMEDAARQAHAMLTMLEVRPDIDSATRAELMRGLLDKMTSDTLAVGVINQVDILSNHPNRFGLNADVRDAKGRSLAQVLAGLSTRGEFAVFQLPRRLKVAGDTVALVESLARPMLVFLLPLDKKWSSQRLVIALAPLDDLEAAEQQTKTSVINLMRERFQRMDSYDHRVRQLLGEGNTPLIDQGDVHPAALGDTLERARREGQAETMLASPFGDMLCLVGHSRAFGWTVVLGAPEAEIRQPSTDLLIPLLGFSALAFALTGLLALALLAHSLSPLRTLLNKTRELPMLDFSSPDVGEQLARDLPLNRQDEVGQLARSFSLMGDELSKKIRNIMGMMAARERMEGELRAASDIQTGILPPPESAPDTPEFQAAAFLQPAKEVGGDFYDFFRLDDGRWALALGDVSGKGVPAALFMAMSVTLARAALHDGLGPAEAMEHVNAQLEAYNPGNMFVTLFLSLYDPETGALVYANGGHCPPFVVDAATGRVRTLENLSGPMAGALPNLAYSQHRDRLEPGEMCLLFTDGVTEAMNSGLQLYGEERLAKMVRDHATDHPADLLKAVAADLEIYRANAPQSDDITMLAFRRVGEKSD